jgi:hypothetical protein
LRTETFEKGVQQGFWQAFWQGFQRGFQQGLCHAVRIVLEKRHGPLSAGAVQRLNAWSIGRLEGVLRADKALSLKELGLQDD